MEAYSHYGAKNFKITFDSPIFVFGELQSISHVHSSLKNLLPITWNISYGEDQISPQQPPFDVIDHFSRQLNGL